LFGLGITINFRLFTTSAKTKLSIAINSFSCSNNFTLQPTIFSIKSQSNEIQSFKNEFQNLLEFDLLQGQLQELFCIRSLKRTDGIVESRDFIAENSQYGNWVFYPWSKVALRILEKREFVELRTSRNRNKITKIEQEELASKTIGIVGMSVGFSVFLTMIMERVAENFKIADFDTLSMSNLNRLPFKLADIGLPKVEIAKRWALEIDPYLNIQVFGEGIDTSNVGEFFQGQRNLDLIVDECDSGNIKLLLRIFAKRFGVPLLMETSDRGLLDVENYQVEDEPIFHGAILESEIDGLLHSQSNEVLMRFIDLSTASKRGIESMMELGKSIDTWPQLASDVFHGGATVTIAARNILLGNPIPSGRYFMDLQQKLGVHGL